MTDEAQAGAVILTFPVTPDQRLRRALASLDMAVRAQGVAVAEWRASLAALQSTMAGLGASWRGYATTIDGVAEQVRQINDQADATEGGSDVIQTR